MFFFCFVLLSVHMFASLGMCSILFVSSGQIHRQHWDAIMQTRSGLAESWKPTCLIFLSWSTDEILICLFVYSPNYSWFFPIFTIAITLGSLRVSRFGSHLAKTLVIAYVTRVPIPAESSRGQIESRLDTDRRWIHHGAAERSRSTHGVARKDDIDKWIGASMLVIGWFAEHWDPGWFAEYWIPLI